jgi:hypothetical protein
VVARTRRRGRSHRPVTGQQTGGHFSISFPRITGGNLAITVTAVIGGQNLSVTSSGLTIVGTNPTRAAIQAAINDDLTQRIACHESSQTQFAAAPGAVSICPLWSGDNYGGVGIFQLTVPAPTEAQVWNWQANVAGGKARLRQCRAQATAYPGQIAQTNSFNAMVTAISTARAAQGQSAITVTIPPFTADQVTDDAIRAYNGYGTNRDQFGLPLHEFRLQMNGSTLQLQIDPATSVGTCVWERVPVAARGTSGDPNYVANVKASSPTCGG